MSTETTHPIGTIMTRKDPKKDAYDVLIVTGVGSKISATSNTEFSDTISLDAKDAFREYDVKYPEGVIVQGPDANFPGLSPEEEFRRLAQESPKAAKKAAK